MIECRNGKEECDLQSMTGCGSGRAARDGWEVTADLKTVNHRFLDVSLRLPRNLLFLEQMTRERLAAGLKRGHVDVFLTVRNTEEGAQEVQTDLHLARDYAEAARKISQSVGISGELSLGHAGFMSLGAFTGVVVSQSLIDSIPNAALRLTISIICGALIAAVAPSATAVVSCRTFLLLQSPATKTPGVWVRHLSSAAK